MGWGKAHGKNPGLSLQGSIVPVKVSAPPSVRALAALKSARWRSILVDGPRGGKCSVFPVMFRGFQGISGDFCVIFVGFQVIFVGFRGISVVFCGIFVGFQVIFVGCNQET